MPEFIASHRISFTDAQKKEILAGVEEILDSGNVVLGEKTKQFEQAYAEACGRRYGVAVGSDTAAFEMQLKILAGPSGNLGGKYVLFPALAFPSILESIVNAGGKPWFFDGDWDGHLFGRLATVSAAAESAKKQTGEYPVAIILMHTGGLIARDSAEITEWCEERNIAVLEDAAHSYGAKLDGRPAGSFGIASAFSLYATKPMHAMEGGVIVTDNEEYANEARIYRNYGRTQDFGRSVIVRHGYSWRMTEMQAVVGLSNLGQMDASVARRAELAAKYDELVEDDRLDGITHVTQSEGMQPNGYRYLLLLPEGWDGERRLKLKQAIKENHGVDLPGEVYELPCHKQPIWQEQYGHLSMPMAEEFCNRHFALPLYQTLDESDLDRIVNAVATEYAAMK